MTDKTDIKADVRALRPIGWFMGGVTVLCTVMAVATGYWTQQRHRDDFNMASAKPPAAAPLQPHMRAAAVTRQRYIARHS